MRVPERAPAARLGGVTPPRGLAWVDCPTRLATAGVRPSMATRTVTTLTYLGIRRDLPQRQGKRRGTKRGKDRSVPSPIKSYVSRWARGWVGLGIDHLPTFSGCHSGGWRTTASVSSQQGSPPIPRINERNASAHTGEKNPLRHRDGFPWRRAPLSPRPTRSTWFPAPPCPRTPGSVAMSLQQDSMVPRARTLVPERATWPLGGSQPLAQSDAGRQPNIQLHKCWENGGNNHKHAYRLQENILHTLTAHRIKTVF